MPDSPVPPVAGLDVQTDHSCTSVLPLSSRPASISSAPGGVLDGTPRYLFSPLSPSLPPPPRPVSPSPPDMAIQPLYLAGIRHEEDHRDNPAKAGCLPVQEVLPQPLPQVSPPAPSPTRPGLRVMESAPPAPNLNQIARALQLRNYQSRRCEHVQGQLFNVQVATARTARLTHTARTVQHALAECIKSEDKQSFSNLFNAFLDASDGCSGKAQPAADPWTLSNTSTGYQSSFLDLLPLASRESLLEFCRRIRCDGNYIADCLASLSHAELLSMLPDRNLSRSNDSVFGSSSWYNSRASRHLGFVVDGQMDLLSSSDFASPLHALFFSPRSISTSAAAENSRTRDVWATVCSRLISNQKPGSEKMVPAVLDLLAYPSKWPGKGRLEQWIHRTLEKGAFLTEQPSKQTFRMRVQGRPETSAEDQARIESFFHEAVGSLLDILGSTDGPSVIPEPVLRMCHAIWKKLDPKPGHQRAFPHFVITRWLFSSFMPDLISLPEAFGLADGVYIPEITRQRVLREVAARTQKAVFDVSYSWKHGNLIPIEITSRVQAVMTRLTYPSGSETGVSRTTEDFRSTQRLEDEQLLAVSANDLLSMMKALFPQRRPASFTFDGDVVPSGLQSSSSSISGFSLFQNVGSLQPTVGSSMSLPPEVMRSESAESVQTVQQGLEKEGISMATEHFTTELHGKSLREACSGLEEVLASGSAKTLEPWAILVMRPTGQVINTTLDELSRISTGVNREPSEDNRSTLHQRCAMSIEELLRITSLGEYAEGGEVLPNSQSLFDVYLQVLHGFEVQARDAEQHGDFLGAYTWMQYLHDFQSLTAKGSDLGLLRTILKGIEHSSLTHIADSAAVIDVCESWIGLLKPCLDIGSLELSAIADVNDHMRDKMWFVADVRTSAAYDEARSVAAALRIMAKPKRQQRTRMTPPLRHWNAPKLSSGNLHLKSEAQILELLSTPPHQGGPNKLSDDQSRATTQWMERNNVENLCHGEERLHKLCMEIRKCVDQLTAAENALVWSSPLFARDNKLQSKKPSSSPSSSSPSSSSPSLAALQGTAGRMASLTLRTCVTPSIDSISSASHPLSSASSRDYLDTKSPALTHRSSTAFWSPAITEAQSPSSATSIGSSRTQAGATRIHASGLTDVTGKRVDALRRSLTSFLLSDIASPLFSDGCETDRAFWTGLGGELTERHLRTLNGGNTGHVPSSRASDTSFDFDKAFKTLLQSFSASNNPSTKLGILYEIDRLLPLRADTESSQVPISSQVPLDKLASARKHMSLPIADISVSGFRTLFCNSAIRPTAIFRDLQYIAALVPSNVLETTPQGKAFWNAAVAIAGLKQELRTNMVETADSIIAYHSNNRGHSHASSTAQLERDSAIFTTPSRTPSASDVDPARYSMADAASLLQITAKEGDPVAQRELATLYLTHPELMDHVIAPFARPGSVFKEELEQKWRRDWGAAEGRGCEPATMCVAWHWMVLSSQGKDALATEFLRQREEMERLP